MRILITGAKGMLGRTLVRRLSDHELLPVDIEEMDILDKGMINALFQKFKPEVVVHSAAMTDVDGCESHSKEALAINGRGSGNIAAACREYDARLIAISTDYVFEGNLGRPYRESDPAEPVTQYGISKLEGEKLISSLCPDHLILRIAWLYGPGGPSFVHTISRLLKLDGEPLKVVEDQLGNPTSTDAVAGAVIDYLDKPIAGIVHCTCEGEASWFQFASEIKKIMSSDRGIVPCSSEEYPRPAPRPANSRLEKQRRREHGYPDMPHWQQCLKDFMKEFTNE